MPRNNHYYNGALIRFSRQLRKETTPHERHLWYDFLRSYPSKIYRQRVISGYIADFYCPAAKLIIELDGSQHFTSDGLASDRNRTDALEQLGISVVRFTNLEIDRQFNAVCTEIDRLIHSRTE